MSEPKTEQYELENGKCVVPASLEEKLKRSPFIANAMVFGDNKPYNVALIVPDADAVHLWASRRGCELLGDWDIVPDVIRLIEHEVTRCSADFTEDERIRKHVLTLEDFTQENGLLTPTLELKRREALSRHKESIEALYRYS